MPPSFLASPFLSLYILHFLRDYFSKFDSHKKREFAASHPRSRGVIIWWMANMATADGALRRLFEKPLPENPSLLEVLAACSNHIHHKKQLLPAVDPASFTEIFGELHFHEKPEARFVLPPSPPHPAAAAPARGPTASWLEAADHQAAEKSKDDSSLDALLRPPKPASFCLKKSASFCLKKSSASLLLCTEGLGSESTVDSDDMVKGDGGDAALTTGKETTAEEEATCGDAEPELLGGGKDKEPPSFPPPIRSIGRGGKPYVCFRTSRADGRFVLKQVVIPGKELLHASREGGRLRLQFANAAASTGDDDDEELKFEDKEDRELQSITTCIGACA